MLTIPFNPSSYPFDANGYILSCDLDVSLATTATLSQELQTILLSKSPVLVGFAGGTASLIPLLVRQTFKRLHVAHPHVKSAGKFRLTCVTGPFTNSETISETNLNN